MTKIIRQQSSVSKLNYSPLNISVSYKIKFFQIFFLSVIYIYKIYIVKQDSVLSTKYYTN